MARQTLLRAFILRYKAVKTWHDEDKLLCVDFALQSRKLQKRQELAADVLKQHFALAREGIPDSGRISSLLHPIAKISAF